MFSSELAAPLPGVPAPLPPNVAAPIPATNASIPPPAPPLPGLSAPPLPGLTAPKLPGLLSILNKTKKKNSPPEYISKPRKKMNYFQWQHIKNVQEDSIWNEISLRKSKIHLKSTMDENKDVKEEKDVEENEKNCVCLDIDSLEELFGKKVKKKVASPVPNGANNMKEDENKKKKRAAKETLLDPKRSYNMCIALARLKLSNKVLKTAILAMSEEHLDAEQIGKLRKLVPTSEEQELLKNWGGTDSKQLAQAERFVYELKDISSIAERLELWQFKLQFQALCDEQQSKVDLLQEAYITMKTSDSFKMFLQFVLLIGNYMNYENAKKGNVDGFQLKSLLSLEASKSVDKTENLLSYIIKQSRKMNPKSLEFSVDFARDLGAVVDCLKSEDDPNKIDIIQLETKINEFGKMRKKLEIKIKELKNDDETDMFEPVMTEFLEDTNDKYQCLVDNHRKIIDDLIALGKYFGQKNDKKLEYIEILLAFSISLNIKNEKINEIEMRKKKAMLKLAKRQKKKEPKSKPKIKDKDKNKNKNKDKRGNDEKVDNNKNESDHPKLSRRENRLLELYHQQRRMLNAKNKTLSPRSMSLSNPSSMTPQNSDSMAKLESPKVMLRTPSLTENILNNVTSDEIKKRREDKRHERHERCNDDLIQNEMMQLGPPSPLKRKTSFKIGFKTRKSKENQSKDNKSKDKKKRKKKKSSRSISKFISRLTEKTND